MAIAQFSKLSLVSTLSVQYISFKIAVIIEHFSHQSIFHLQFFLSTVFNQFPEESFFSLFLHNSNCIITNIFLWEKNEGIIFDLLLFWMLTTWFWKNTISRMEEKSSVFYLIVFVSLFEIDLFTINRFDVIFVNIQ